MFIEAERIEVVNEETDLENFMGACIKQYSEIKEDISDQFKEFSEQVESRQKVERKRFMAEHTERRMECSRDPREYQRLLREKSEFEERQRREKESNINGQAHNMKKEFLIRQQVRHKL